MSNKRLLLLTTTKGKNTEQLHEEVKAAIDKYDSAKDGVTQIIFFARHPNFPKVTGKEL